MTENGCAIEPKETSDVAPGASADAAVNDTGRIAYFQGYLEEMHNAIQLGADVRAVRLPTDLEECSPEIFLWLPFFALFSSPLACTPFSRHGLLPQLLEHVLISSRCPSLTNSRLPSLVVVLSSSARQYYAWSFMDNFGKARQLEIKVAAAITRVQEPMKTVVLVSIVAVAVNL